LRQGQTVQFHLRDAQTSIDDLDHILTSYRSRAGHDQVTGALLFSCLGRGEFLYGHRNHDTRLFADKMGQIPVSGFFCNGEIGPVAGTTYLHGYTSCFALFRPLYVTDISASIQPTLMDQPLPPPRSN
jgi:small ligand-binding sensory domain FIST